MNISQEALRDIVTAFPYTFFIGSKSWDLLSSEPPRGDSSATESRFATSWVIASPQRLIATILAALVSSVRRVSEYSSSFIDLEDHPYLEIGCRIGTSYP